MAMIGRVCMGLVSNRRERRFGRLRLLGRMKAATGSMRVGALIRAAWASVRA